MEKRICPHCNIEYPPTRSDQKYCNSTCRWNAWRKRKEEKQKNKNPEKEEEKTQDLFSTLRGVEQTNEPELHQESVQQGQEKIIEIPKNIVEPIQVETKEYNEVMAEKTRVDAFGKRVLNDLHACEKGISMEKENIQRISKRTVPSVNNKYRTWNMDMEDLFGREYEDRIMDNKFLLEESKKKLLQFENKKEELNKELQKANKEMQAVVTRMKNIPQFEKPKQLENSTALSGLLKELNEHKINQQQPQVRLLIQIPPVRQPEIIPVKKEIELPVANGKFISSRQLRGKKFDMFPFTGKWEEFFGRPSFTFHLAVHGKPGEGKSTFCMQFADYLATHFGKVVYISAEEGINATLQAKVDYNKIDNPHLIFADLKSYDEIKKEIKPIYNFIFIDSLDTLGIDAKKLKELKQLFSQSAFITISQSTKAGGMRGSQEIMHDSDITAKVANKIAVTEKNRFKERGMKYQVLA